MSRSVTVAVIYVMCVTSLSWRDALKAVQGARSVAYPNVGFLKQIQEFSKERLQDERRRIRAKYPNWNNQEEDEKQANDLMMNYEHCLNSGEMCDGNCPLGVQCPRGLCNKSRGFRMYRRSSRELQSNKSKSFQTSPENTGYISTNFSSNPELKIYDSNFEGEISELDCDNFEIAMHINSDSYIGSDIVSNASDEYSSTAISGTKISSAPCSPNRYYSYYTTDQSPLKTKDSVLFDVKSFKGGKIVHHYLRKYSSIEDSLDDPSKLVNVNTPPQQKKNIKVKSEKKMTAKKLAKPESNQNKKQLSGRDALNKLRTNERDNVQSTNMYSLSKDNSQKENSEDSAASPKARICQALNQIFPKILAIKSFNLCKTKNKFEDNDKDITYIDRNSTQEKTLISDDNQTSTVLVKTTESKATTDSNTSVKLKTKKTSKGDILPNNISRSHSTKQSKKSKKPIRKKSSANELVEYNYRSNKNIIENPLSSLTTGVDIEIKSRNTSSLEADTSVLENYSGDDYFDDEILFVQTSMKECPSLCYATPVSDNKSSREGILSHVIPENDSILIGSNASSLLQSSENTIYSAQNYQSDLKKNSTTNYLLSSVNVKLDDNCDLPPTVPPYDVLSSVRTEDSNSFYTVSTKST